MRKNKLGDAMWSQEERDYYNSLYQEMLDQVPEAQCWLEQECGALGSKVDFLYGMAKFQWGQLVLFVPYYDPKRDTCALRIPLFGYETKAHFLTTRELSALSDLAGKFGDKFGWRMKTDSIWSDTTTHLWYIVKPKFDPKRSGVA